MLRISVKYLLNSSARRHLLTSTQIRQKSSEYVAKEKPLVQRSEDDRQEIKESGDTTSKLPQRAPLVKNFMLAVVDKDLLRFPEVISRDDTGKLTDATLPVQTYFKSAVDSNAIDLTRLVPKEVLDNLKSLGVFGWNIPMNYGGKGYSRSELTLASEPEQDSADLATILLPHRVVSDVISEFGTDYQKNKYLTKLANGSIVATEAIFETEPTDSQFFGTTAEYNEMDKVWTLNGEKSFVINATDANLFVVLAQINVMNTSGQMEDKIGVFLVDSTVPGVKVNGPVQTFGLRGTQQGTVCFKNAIVSEDCVIGDFNDSTPIAQALLKSNRLKTPLICTGMLKNQLLELTDYSTHTKQNGVYLKDNKLNSDRLARIVCSIYAMESMTYLTTGLIDEFDQQDVELEAAITKLYSLENLWKNATTSMDFMGTKCLEASQRWEHFIRNAAQLYTQGETIDSLRLYIGLSAIQYSGMHIHDTIRKDRNAMFNPMHVFHRMFEKQSNDSPKMTLELHAEVHPSLDVASKCTEQSILRLRMAAEVLLGRHGSNILQEPLDVLRITECITLIYAMFASTARASRSYCIGLKHSDYELLIATMVAFEGATRVKAIVSDIVTGPYITNDVNNQKIAKQLIKSKKYFYEHPIKYNF